MTAKHDSKLAEFDKHFATDELAQLRALFQLMKDPIVLTRWILIMMGIILLSYATKLGAAALGGATAGKS